MTQAPEHTYIPWKQLVAEPNIMVDGAAKDGTLITLSHWPKSGTAENLKADSSTDIVFRYLDTPTMHVPTTIVTGDHFDEDASLGIFALLEPEFAEEFRDIICGAATAGDFATYHDRWAARIAFTIMALGDPSISPLDKDIFDQGYDDMCADLFKEILPRIKPIIEHPGAFQELWQPEDAFLTKSEKALANGSLTMQEYPDVSLCVVTVTDDLRTDADRNRARRGDLPYHPMAVNNATECDRILTITGNTYVLSYRYESWVQYISAPPMPRMDLHPLAAELSASEPEGHQWVFDGVEKITPTLRLKNVGGNDVDSTITSDDLVDRIVMFMEGAEPAWDPYDHPGDKPAMLLLSH